MSDIKFTPCIILPGIGQSKVELLDNNGEKVGMVWPLDVDGSKYLDGLKGALMKTMLFRKDAGLSKGIAKALDEILEPLTTNPDGTMRHPHRIVKYPSLAECTENEKRYVYRMVPLQQLAEVIGEENLYFFAYNSFGRPFDTAKDLDELIQQVKAKTGAEQVNLVPVSLGGALSTAYFYEYGYKNDVKRVMYFVAAIDGSMLIADIMAKRLLPENVSAAVETLANKKTAEALDKLLPAFPKDCFNSIFNTAIDKLLEKAIINCPSMWSVVPKDEYDALAQKYLMNSGIKEQTDKYHQAQLGYPEMLRKLQGQGTQFFAICGYNLNLLKIAASNEISSDGIVHINSSGLFAKAAKAGEKLEAGERLSPDGNIDGASGLLPDSTWYFLNQQHDATAYNDTALAIASRVLSDDSFTDIYSDEKYPQFGMVSDNRH